ncbi:MAG: DUF305 domain-containing protein [Lachnospiraceae bacterium]|nr:DUF305 domain-containing protein [Lachnospiraceae bacterium]
MLEPCSFRTSTKEYLSRFYEILDKMIHGMENAPLTNSISQNFIVQMIPHHRAAISMSENVLQYTTCIPLQKIASNIIAMQTQSIHDMWNVLECCRLQTDTCQDIRLYRRTYKTITQTMFTQMDTARATNNISETFMREMIPHHEGAVRMSENALRYCICPELVPILNAIITSQEAGIKQMKQLLSEQSCRPC